MKSITVKIKVPPEIRDLLMEYYNDKTLACELRDECEEFLWDIYHALNKVKAKAEKMKREKAA